MNHLDVLAMIIPLNQEVILYMVIDSICNIGTPKESLLKI